MRVRSERLEAWKKYNHLTFFVDVKDEEIKEESQIELDDREYDDDSYDSDWWAEDDDEKAERRLKRKGTKKKL